MPAFTSSEVPTSTSLRPYPAWRSSTTQHAVVLVSRGPAARRRRGSRRRGGSAQVGLDHLGVALHLVGRALGDDLAAVEDGDHVAELADHVHVVLDEHDGDAALVDPLDDLHLLHHVGVGQAGGRLVEDEQLGPAGQGPGDLQEALGAVGEVLGRGAGLVPQPDELEQGERLGLGPPLLGARQARAAPAAAGRGRRPAAPP